MEDWNKKYLAEKKARLEAQLQLVKLQFDLLQKDYQDTVAAMVALEAAEAEAAAQEPPVPATEVPAAQ